MERSADRAPGSHAETRGTADRGHRAKHTLEREGRERELSEERREIEPRGEEDDWWSGEIGMESGEIGMENGEDSRRSAKSGK